MVKWDTVINIRNGKNQKKVENLNGQYPIYGSGGIMGYATDFLCEENTVIIGRKGNINKPIFVETKFWNVDTAFGLEAKKNRLISKYLYYFCINFNFEKLNTTVTIPSLTKTNLQSIEMLIPPLEVQQQIVQNLDTVSELLALRKKQLEELDGLVKSVFYDMFGDPVTNDKGWVVKSLQELLDNEYVIGHLDGNHGELYPKSSEFVDMGIPYIGANCIDNFSVNFDKAKYLPIERALKFKKGVAKCGDILFAHNATVGPVALLNYDNIVILSTSLTYYRCNLLKMNNKYLMYFMNSPFFSHQYSKNMGQTTRNQVPITMQRRFLHIVPPIDLQNQFASIATKIEEQKSSVKQSIEETQQLFDSLMSQYFD